MAAIRRREGHGLKSFDSPPLNRPVIRAFAQAMEQAGIRPVQRARRVGALGAHSKTPARLLTLHQELLPAAPPSGVQVQPAYEWLLAQPISQKETKEAKD